MGLKIIIYDAGDVYELNEDDIYNPFPEPKQEPEQESTEDSQEIQSL